MSIRVKINVVADFDLVLNSEEIGFLSTIVQILPDMFHWYSFQRLENVNIPICQDAQRLLSVPGEFQWVRSIQECSFLCTKNVLFLL